MSLDKLKSSILFPFSLFLLTIFFLTGCAEMVSGAKPDAGSVLKVRVKLGADPLQSDYKYVFVYSQKEIKAETNYYIFLPGQTVPDTLPSGALSPTNNSEINSSRDIFINYYYENVFSTWSDFIYLVRESNNQTQAICDASNTYFPVTANIDTHLAFNLSPLSGGYWSFSNVSGNYDIDFQIDFQALGNSKPLTDQTFYFKFFSIGANGNIFSSIEGSIKNNKKEIPFTGERLGDPLINDINDILRMEVRVI